MFAVQLFKMFACFIYVFTVSSLTHAESSPRDQEGNYCLLPPYPENGRYTINNYPFATPGERYSSVKLDISCDTGYLNNNTIKSIFCVNGEWSATMHTCVRDLLGFCTLSIDDLKVEYRCLRFSGTLGWSRECESMVPSGTLVRPICRSPAYFALRPLSEMHCRNGMWDYNPICKPACGLTTQHLQFEGTSGKHLELPWHTVIYKKSSEYYYSRCSGSLITASKIISTAYCFHYKNELLPTSIFMVAVNKMYQPYNDTRDRNSQHSAVAEIIIPSTYRGNVTYYEDNIAVVVVKTPFFFHLSVRPVCLDFDNDLDRTQLAEGNSGKAARWSAIVNYGQSPDLLNVVDIMYIKNEDCDTMWPTRYRQSLTKDKFCATNENDVRLGMANPGSGIAFLESTTQRYFLLGVRSNQLIFTDDSTYLYSYTSILKHEHFLKQHLNMVFIPRIYDSAQLEIKRCRFDCSKKMSYCTQ